MNPRLKELFGMLMIGDGALGTVAPRAHCLLWRHGSPIWKKMISFFARRPELTRLLAVGEVATGLWLAQRQWRAQAIHHRLVRTSAAPRALAHT